MPTTPTKLKDYPLVLDNINLLIPNPYKETWNAVEDIKQSAGGTDIYTNTRARKLSISFSYKVTSDWLKTLATLNNKSRTQSLTLKRYDPIQEGYTEHQVKMKNFSYQVDRKSWDITASFGLYKVSFTLEEI